MLRKNKCSFCTVKSYQVVNLSVSCTSFKLTANLKLQITHLLFDQSMGLFLVNSCFLSSWRLLDLGLKTSMNQFTTTSTVNLRADAFSFLKHWWQRLLAVWKLHGQNTLFDFQKNDWDHIFSLHSAESCKKLQFYLGSALGERCKFDSSLSRTFFVVNNIITHSCFDGLPQGFLIRFYLCLCCVVAIKFLMMHDDKWCITLFLPCTSFFITK